MDMSINTFKTNIPDWAQFSRHRFLLPFLIIILTFLLIIIFTRRKIDSDITRIGNYFCIILLLLSVCQISYFSLITNLHKTRLFVSNSTPVSEEKPDIYYIVLDTYAREDTLKGISHSIIQLSSKSWKTLVFLWQNAAVVIMHTLNYH